MQTKVKEVEHSPTPQTSRGIYGFIFASLCASFIVSYAFWILIPGEIIETWPYQPPQKYWAAAVPIFFCTGLFLFVFFIYPSLHIVHDGKLDEPSAISDPHAVSRDRSIVTHPTITTRNRAKTSFPSIKQISLLDVPIDELREVPIPSAWDIDIEDVSKILYLNQDVD